MGRLDVGVVGASNKDGDLRRPIHPSQLDRIDPDLRPRIFLEHGYGEHFGVSDEQMSPWVGGLRSREELIAHCDVILLPKPTHADVEQLRDGQVLWGWPHCVQDATLTQLAIDKRLTLVAWEAMNFWHPDGGYALHVFHMNNEIAGYASVMHAMQILGRTGHYGRHLNAVVISFGATGRGAVTALQAMGVADVTVLSHRATTAVAAPPPGVLLGHFERTARDAPRTVTVKSTGPVPTAAFLAEHDIIVNCVLQDVTHPLMFVNDDEVGLFKPGTIFVDVSCDEGMGFVFSRATTFAEPIFSVGNGAHCYGVDHSPSFLWNSATWEISEAILPFLRPVIEGPSGWDANETIRRAIEIRDGVIQNPQILAFQRRNAEYPHEAAAPPAPPDAAPD